MVWEDAIGSIIALVEFSKGADGAWRLVASKADLCVRVALLAHAPIVFRLPLTGKMVS